MIRRFGALVVIAGLATLVAAASATQVELPGTPPTTTTPSSDVPLGTEPPVATTTTAKVPLRTLRMGSRGDYVKDLQEALRKRGIRVKVDGRFGKGTRRGVKIIQKRMKLRATGVAKTGFQRRLGMRPRKIEIAVTVSTVALSAARSMSFVRPARGKITSGFGPRGGRNHDGIDIPGKNGAPILASATGKITRVGWQSGYGNRIVVNHGNGVATLYAHLSTIEVQKGQLVAQGQRIGGMGTTGRSTTVHLHFEIRIKGIPVDPVPYL